MGLLKHLLFWPVTGPEFLIKFSLGKVEDAAREQLTDDQSVKEELLALQMQLELGEVDDEEYVAREAELMQRLRDVRHWREQFGMGTGGGPVRVARREESGAADEEAEGERVGDSAPAEPVLPSTEGASVEVNFDWE
jgi:hypothetical protein